jgi:hypothetical protein
LVAAGVAEAGNMQGLGYLCNREQGWEIEGEIRHGVLDGEGLKRDLTNKRAMFGKFSKGDIRSLETLEDKRDAG